MGVLAAQRDFTSPGGTRVLRNAVIPDMPVQLPYEHKNAETKREFQAGVGSGYRIIRPLSFTEKAGNKFVTDESVPGLSLMTFVKIKTVPITAKFQAVYGQNLFDQTMLGGYAVATVSDSVLDKGSQCP